MKPHPKKKFGLEPGDEISVRYAGGGGFFSPLERDPEKVREDVLNGYVSIEKAEREYGVVIHPGTGEVVLDRTVELRTRRQKTV